MIFFIGLFIVVFSVLVISHRVNSAPATLSKYDECMIQCSYDFGGRCVMELKKEQSWCRAHRSKCEERCKLLYGKHK